MNKNDKLIEQEIFNQEMQEVAKEFNRRNACTDASAHWHNGAFSVSTQSREIVGYPYPSGQGLKYGQK